MWSLESVDGSKWAGDPGFIRRRYFRTPYTKRDSSSPRKILSKENCTQFVRLLHFLGWHLL